MDGDDQICGYFQQGAIEGACDFFSPLALDTQIAFIDDDGIRLSCQFDYVGVGTAAEGDKGDAAFGEVFSTSRRPSSINV